MRFLIIVFILCVSSTLVYAQEAEDDVKVDKCGSCSSTNLFKGESKKPGNGNDHIVVVNSSDNNWEKKLTATDLVEFPPIPNKEYEWLARSNDLDIVKIKGIVLQPGVTLTIGRWSNDEEPAFEIEGGCIVVKDGATLNFAYYSKMKNLVICVENGGGINFDSKPEGQSDGKRDNFVFEDIDIVLAPHALAKFGNAEIEQLGYIVIDGYEGEGCTLNDDGTLTPPNANIQVDLFRMSQAELVLFCNFLQNAGFTIQPVEWHEVSANFYSSNRSTSINWSTLKEWENSHFEIERSIGGVNNYQKIGRVEGMGWADEITEYSFCDDELPLAGGRVYYRIKQVDFDGTFDYSQTMMVNVPGLQVTKGEWRAYPNPIRGQEFRIARLASEDLKSDIQVKILTSQLPIASFKVKNEEELNTYLDKLLPRIPQGIFVVELQSNKQVEYLKVIKE